MQWRVTSPQGAGQPQAGPAKRDAAMPHTIGRRLRRRAAAPIARAIGQGRRCKMRRFFTANAHVA
jgi:hypothetical protein